MVPPPRLERGFLPPEGNALSTELWGRLTSRQILPRDERGMVFDLPPPLDLCSAKSQIIVRKSVLSDGLAPALGLHLRLKSPLLDVQ